MSDHDFSFEPARGLPAKLPAGETILWQGSPDSAALAIGAYKANWIFGYMMVLALWRTARAWADGGFPVGIATLIPYLVLAAAVYGAVRLMAWAQARASIYTITTDRIILRIGAALPVTYTIPFRRMAAAHLEVKPDGTGTIAVEISEGLRLSYAVLWPHLRPGHGRQPQPALRCIPGATAVARILAEAAQTKVNEPVLTRATPGAVLAAE